MRYEPFRPASLAAERLIQFIAVSPDGLLVAYSVRTIAKELDAYRSHVVVVDVRDGAPVHRTSGPVRDMAPAFSPDGGSVYFMSDRATVPQVFALDLANGDVSQVTDLPLGLKTFSISPDGTRLLVLAPSGINRFVDDARPLARVVDDLTWRLDGVGVRDQYTSAWEVTLSDGRARRLTEPTYEVFAARWDGNEKLVFLADRGPDAAIDELPQVHRMSVAEPLVVSGCELPGAIFDLAVSPSGKLAIAGTAAPGAPVWSWAELGVFVEEHDGLRGLALDEEMTATNATFGDFIEASAVQYPQICWLDDEHVVTIAGHRGRAYPAILGLDGTRQLIGSDNMTCYRVAAGGGRLAFVAACGGAPAELFVTEPDGGLRKLTDEGAWIGAARLDPRPFVWQGPDLPRPDGWLVTADEPVSPGPLVVHIHGGPQAAHGPSPWLEMVALADAGIRVLYLNPPGSLGYGADYTRRLTRAWGSGDEEHVLSAIDAAVQQGIADPARIGVMGLSYGGFLTLWLLGRHGHRFAAGLCENPPSELASWAGSSDFGWLTGPRGIDLEPLPSGGHAHLAASPLGQLTGDVPPLLLMQSEADLRCPPHQTDQVFTSLRRRGRPVTMVRYPDESHGMAMVGRPDRRIDRLERIVEFFRRELGS